MKIYRIFTIDYEYVPSDYVDEDGYVDDYYDKWIENEITLQYCDSLESANKWIKENCDDELDTNIEEISVYIGEDTNVGGE